MLYRIRKIGNKYYIEKADMSGLVEGEVFDTREAAQARVAQLNQQGQ